VNNSKPTVHIHVNGGNLEQVKSTITEVFNTHFGPQAMPSGSF
jgi:hypothetical protein